MGTRRRHLKPRTTVAPPSAKSWLAAGSPVHECADDHQTLEVDGLLGRFSLHFQPEIDLVTDTVVRAEALLRWQHPTLGTLRPGAALQQSRWATWLPVLERWALLQAARQAGSWRGAGTAVRVTANVSPDLALSGELTSVACGAIREAGVGTGLLSLDLPVRSVLSGVRGAQVDVLFELGFELNADGVVGRRTVQHLVPHLTTVKVPLRAPGAACRSLLHLQQTVTTAHDRGFTAIATGLETAEDFALVTSAGSDRASGTFLAPPTTPGAVLSRHRVLLPR